MDMFVDMNMPQLNLPNAALKTKLVEGTTQVFDAVRKKYLVFLFYPFDFSTSIMCM